MLSLQSSSLWLCAPMCSCMERFSSFRIALIEAGCGSSLADPLEGKSTASLTEQAKKGRVCAMGMAVSMIVVNRGAACSLLSALGRLTQARVFLLRPSILFCSGQAD